MEAEINDPLAVLNEHIPSTVKLFDFARPPTIVGRSTIQHHENPDIYNGMAVLSQSYFRVARHKPTGTLCLFASKAPQNLRGNWDTKTSTSSSITASHKGLEHSYIIAAFRSSGDNKDTYKVANLLRRSMFRYAENLGERCEKHFTLYGVNLTNPDKRARVFNTDTPTEVWTNGRIAYLLDQTEKRKWKLTFYAPVRRKNGSFVPFNLSRNILNTEFAKVSRVITCCDNYNHARQNMAEHWQKISSHLWDEQNIYKDESLSMQVSRYAADTVNKIMDKGLRLAFVTTSVGLALGIFNPKYGLVGGLTAAILHTIMDHVADESYVTSKEAIERTKEAKRRLDINAYPFNEDVSNHFKIQTSSNITRLCAKLDLDRFSANEFEFLNAQHSGLLRDHENIIDGFRPDSLKDQVLSMHQRGFSGTCVLPDKNTRLDMFQSGLVRLIHTLPDGKVKMYAGYRADLCVNESLRLPKEYIDRLKNGIVSNEYDRKRENFNHAFIPYQPSLDDIIKEIEPTMFRNQPELPTEVKQHSLNSIREIFAGCAGERIPAHTIRPYPPLPDLRAIL